MYKIELLAKKIKYLFSSVIFFGTVYIVFTLDLGFRFTLWRSISSKGLCTNHVDKIRGIFDPLLPHRRHFY